MYLVRLFRPGSATAENTFTILLRTECMNYSLLEDWGLVDGANLTQIFRMRVNGSFSSSVLPQ